MLKLFPAILILSVFNSRLFAQTKQDVSFSNGKVTIAGTCFLPAGKGPFPAVAVTHGSGKEGRRDAGYISLAQTLTAQGFAVLIYDKRGVGSSGGSYVEVPDINLPAGDLIEAVRYLKTRPDIDRKNIGVYGHSQGGWVAPAAAVACEDIAFVIVSCGGAVSIREQDLFSYRAQLQRQNFSTPAIDSAIVFGRTLFTYIGTGIGYAAANMAYEEAVKKAWFSFYKAMGFSDRLPPPSMLKEPVFNFFKAINYDPQATLRALHVPTLVLLAEKDEIIPSEKCKQLWEDAFYAGGTAKNLALEIIPEESHYDFEITGGTTVYKKTFSDPIIKWLMKFK